VSDGLKWAILLSGLLITSMGVALLRNSFGVADSWLWSIGTGLFTGGLFVLCGRAMGLLGKKAQ